MGTVTDVDLTSHPDVTTALLDNPLAWRLRVVEQVDIDSPNSALRRRSLLCAPMRPLVAGAGALPRRRAATVTSALLALPVAPMPKRPLLDFDVEGPAGSPAFLLPRASIAAFETTFVVALAARAGLRMTREAVTVAQAALGFTEAGWPEFKGDVARYLAAGTGLAPTSPEIAEWIDLSHQVGTALAPLAEVPDPLNNPVENPSLVVPGLLSAGLVPSYGAVTHALIAYRNAVLESSGLAASAGPAAEDAATFLDALIDYGVTYDLLAVVRVPLDEPFVVKMVERRPMRLSPVTSSGTQPVVIADAQSNHVTLRVTDPNARLAGVRARAYGVDRDAYGSFTSLATPQVHAFYAFDDERDYRIVLAFRVAVLRRLQLVPYSLAALLAALAWFVRTTRPGEREFALLVGPGALAASLLFAREASALGSRLRRTSTSLVVAGVAALLLVSAWQYRYG